jgi:hypothetical protein
VGDYEKRSIGRSSGMKVERPREDVVTEGNGQCVN